MKKLPKEFLEEITKTLSDEEKKLESEIKDLETQDPFSNPDRLNDNAALDMEASEEADHDRVRAVIDQLKGKIIDISKTHIRIKDGMYGVCDSCKTSIDTKRLKALPTATLCLSCEEKKRQIG
ncbi:TraR/DksA family transcriptional regulator [Patescibacteria group bacterium]